MQIHLTSGLSLLMDGALLATGPYPVRIPCQ